MKMKERKGRRKEEKINIKIYVYIIVYQKLQLIIYKSEYDSFYIYLNNIVFLYKPYK